MGLDMYLEKETYIGANYEHRNVSGTIDIQAHGEPVPIQFNRISEVVEQVAYWRKANAIHQWFVEHVQDGEDDCGRYYASRDKLEELLTAVNTVLESSKLIEGVVSNGQRLEDGKWMPIFEAGKSIEDFTVAHRLLPVQSGFFFGSTDYDQWYWETLVYTRDILTALLKEPKTANYYYKASW